MLLSYKLLNKYVDLTGVKPEQLSKILTDMGLEVEQVLPLASGSDLVIGYVKENKKHPESNKLSINQVDIGSEVIQIVCGAPNVRAGLYVIVAKNGCVLPNAKINLIKKVEIAGVESNGMICSLSELGIASKYLSEAQLDGIEELALEYPLGNEALSTMNLDDYIFDLSLTPNRSDAYSIYAIAIDVAAALKKEVKILDNEIKTTNKAEYTISIKDEACTSYGLFTYNNITSQASNQIIKHQLMALGFKPRFDIVDNANLAMVISGNPLHTFDADKLSSKDFIITKGQEKDDFLALDDKTYQITKEDLVIMNGNEIVAIAGVIGSKCSCIDENTTNIVVEAAVFNHVSIRNSARRHDLYSEASTRFSKIVNPYTLAFSINTFEEYQDVKADAYITENYKTYEALNIEVKYQKILDVLGIEISLEQCIELLEDLTFKVNKKDDVIIVSPPSYRKDVVLDVDVIEEVIRMYGFDNITSTLPKQVSVFQELSNIQQITRHVTKTFIAQGLNEIITYQLNSQSKLDRFSDNKEYLELAHPISDERRYFRNQLLSNMIEVILYNKSYQNNDLSLFEVSNVYLENKEQRFLAIGLSGLYLNNPLFNVTYQSDFYILKGLIFDLMQSLGFTYGRFQIKEVESNHQYLHPTKSAYVTFNNQIIGAFGEIHPVIAKDLKLKNTFVGSLNLSVLANNVGQVNKYNKVSSMPSVNRDLSLVINKEIKADQVLKVVKQSNNKLIKDVVIFDLYTGDKVSSDAYSLSLSIKIQDETQTLNEETITTVMNSVISNLESKLDIKLRS